MHAKKKKATQVLAQYQLAPRNDNVSCQVKTIKTKWGIHATEQKIINLRSKWNLKEQNNTKSLTASLV